MAGSAASAGKPLLVVICGPTAAGKTALALELGNHFDLEVISADSRQVYRGMDIGTAKPTPDELSRLLHHLVDVVDPVEEFTAFDFVEQGRRLVLDIHQRRRLPFVVGGTGLYIRALTDGLVAAPGGNSTLRQELRQIEQEQGEGALYRLLQERDPDMATRIHPRNQVRIVRALEVLELSGQRLSAWQSSHAFADRPFTTLKIGLSPDRDELFRRIDRRAELMLEGGLIEETRDLLARGYSPRLKSLQTIGYRECIQYLQGEISLDETLSQIQRATRQYAKRQLTWFRKDDSIIWVDSCQESARILPLIDKFYAA
jgi:tRNA dimethylallyltransferase